MARQTFTASQVLTAAQMTALQGNDFNQTVSTKTASYTLVAADAGTKVVMNAGSTNTTITVNTSLFSAGDTLTILNISTSGTCTVTAGTATVATAGSLALGLNQGGTLYFTSAGVSVFQADGVAATASGLTLISTTTLAAAGTATITNCFTATYRNYKILIEGVSSADVAILGQLRVGGVTTTTNYSRQRLEATSSTVYAVFDSGLSAFYFVGAYTSRPNSVAIDIFTPQEAVPTSYQAYGFYNYTNPVLQLQAGKQTSSTSFDSLVISVSSGNFTGTVSIYGYSI